MRAASAPRARASRAASIPTSLIVEPGDTGVDQDRSGARRRRSRGYRPFEGRRRVVIIDEADALVPPAQNALLKTLEEPPSLVGLHPRDVAAGHAAADGAVALSAAALPAAVATRSRRADARGTARRARAMRATADGSVGRAQASAGDWSRRAIAQRVLRMRAARPGRRLEAQGLLAKGGGGAIASSWRRTCAPWRRCCATSRCWRPAPTTAALANPDVQPDARAAGAGVRGERGAARVCGGRSRTRGARPQRRRQDRGRLAGVAAMSAPHTGAAARRRQADAGRPARRRSSPGDTAGRRRAPARRSRRRADRRRAGGRHGRARASRSSTSGAGRRPTRRSASSASRRATTSSRG